MLGSRREPLFACFLVSFSRPLSIPLDVWVAMVAQEIQIPPSGFLPRLRNDYLPHIQAVHYVLESGGVLCYLGIAAFANIARF